jgi:cytoskeletal protein RodZ
MAQNVYTICPTITIGCFLYTNSSLTTPVADGYYSNGVSYFFVTGGKVISQGLCNPPTTSTTTSTTTAPTTSTTTSTTTSPTTSTTTTTTTESLVTNLIFDLLAAVGGYTVSFIEVNNVVPTLTGGSDVPFSTDTHSYNTNQIGSNQILEITITDFTLAGCITVTDSNNNVSQQNITGNQVYTFTGLIIDNITPVTVVFTDGNC